MFAWHRSTNDFWVLPSSRCEAESNFGIPLVLLLSCTMTRVCGLQFPRHPLCCREGECDGSCVTACAADASRIVLSKLCLLQWRRLVQVWNEAGRHCKPKRVDEIKTYRLQMLAMRVLCSPALLLTGYCLETLHSERRIHFVLKLVALDNPCRLCSAICANVKYWCAICRNKNMCKCNTPSAF